MSYKLNINKIDTQLKTVFKEIKIDNSDYRQLDIVASNPLEETVNEKMRIHLFISQANLNNNNPILEWGYYTDSNDLKNHIKFKTSIDSIGTSLNEIVKNKRLSESYLDSIKPEEKINESVEVKDEGSDTIENINQTYELSENNLKIYGNKLKNYLFEQLGILVDDLELEYYDTTSGKKREPSFINTNDPEIGDEPNMVLRGISSISYDGNISPKGWITLENHLRKLPHLEDINSNTHKYFINITFSTKVFVELH